eukprot:3900979-Rhodomonas_salina.3
MQVGGCWRDVSVFVCAGRHPRGDCGVASAACQAQRHGPGSLLLAVSPPLLGVVRRQRRAVAAGAGGQSRGHRDEGALDPAAAPHAH